MAAAHGIQVGRILEANVVRHAGIEQPQAARGTDSRESADQRVQHGGGEVLDHFDADARVVGSIQPRDIANVEIGAVDRICRRVLLDPVEDPCLRVEQSLEFAQQEARPCPHVKEAAHRPSAVQDRLAGAAQCHALGSLHRAYPLLFPVFLGVVTDQ